MPIGLLPVLVVKCQNVHRAVLGQRGAQIHRLSVQLGGAGRPVESHGDVAAERVDGRPFRDLPDVAALAGDVQHVCSFLSEMCGDASGTGADPADKKSPVPGQRAALPPRDGAEKPRGSTLVRRGMSASSSAHDRFGRYRCLPSRLVSARRSGVVAGARVSCAAFTATALSARMTAGGLPFFALSPW